MRRMFWCALILGAILPVSAAAQDGEKPIDVKIVGHVVKPKKVEATQDRISQLKLPDGFKIDVFADKLINPRMLAIAEDGTLYATRRSVGDVIMLKDENGDGKADEVKTVAGRPNMHGIAIDGDTVYLVTVKDIYKGKIQQDGSFGELKRIVDDLPDAGQHPNRTLAVGPDRMLYVSVGSTCNACNESNPENATLLQVRPDGSARRIFASGLRNTIGFAFSPETGKLYGADHGIDWLGDKEQLEEFNLIEQGKTYGWPYVYGKDGKNPQDEPPADMTLEEWAKASVAPVLTYTAHAAPMQMAFYTGGQFPDDYVGDAFISMRGSWNRKPPSGYEVVRVKFDEGKPQSIEPFITGFLADADGDPSFFGRPVGLAVGKDGALFFSDDVNGLIYRVSYGDAQVAQTENREQATLSYNAAASPQETPRKLAVDVVSADADLEVKSPAFEQNGRIPLRYSAYDQDYSPELSWSKGPDGTKSYVLLMEDIDAPNPKPFVHWVLYNLPADVTHLREGIPGTAALPEPEGARQGVNSRGSFGYFGPKPPDDADHHYTFQVFALDTTLDLKADASRKDVLDAMQGHVLAQGQLTGIFRKPGAGGA